MPLEESISWTFHVLLFTFHVLVFALKTVHCDRFWREWREHKQKWRKYAGETLA